MTHATGSGPADRTVAAPVVESLAGVEDPAMRRRAFLSRLAGLDPEAAAAFLNGIIALSIERHRSAAALVPLVADLRTLTDALGQRPMGAILDAARRTGRAGLVRLLTAQAARRGYDDSPEGGDDQSGPSGLPLGWRTQLGRTGSRDTMDRLVYDQQPRVIENLLTNPRCTEREVVRIAAHRPTSARILAVVFRHPRWVQRYQVKRALALNPYAAPAQAIGLLPSLLTQDLEAIAGDQTLHRDVAAAAATLLVARGSRTADAPPPAALLLPDETLPEPMADEEDGGVIEASEELKAALAEALKDIEGVEAMVEAAGEAAAKGRPEDDPALPADRPAEANEHEPRRPSRDTDRD